MDEEAGITVDVAACKTILEAVEAALVAILEKLGGDDDDDE